MKIHGEDWAKDFSERIVAVAGMKLNEAGADIRVWTEGFTRVVIYPTRSLDKVGASEVSEEENFEEEIDLTILDEIETNESTVDTEAVTTMIEEPVEETATEDDVTDITEESETTIDSVEEPKEEELSMDAIDQLEGPETVMDIADTTQEIEAVMDVADIVTEELAMDHVETEAFEGYELENLGEKSILEPTEEIANSAEVSEDTSMLDDILANAEQQTDSVDTMEAVNVTSVFSLIAELAFNSTVK